MTGKNYLFRASDAGTLISCYRGRVRTAEVEVLFTHLDAHLAANAAPLCVVTIIENGATLGERGRQVIAQKMREKNNGVVAWAMIVDKAGLWGTIVRTITTTVRLMSKSTYPFKVFATVEEGVAWLEEHSPVTLGNLAEEIEEARRALAAS